MQAKQLQEEEELSEDEMEKQKESNEQYQIKKTIKEKNLERFNSLKAKQDKEDEKLGAYIEDETTVKR